MGFSADELHKEKKKSVRNFCEWLNYTLTSNFLNFDASNAWQMGHDSPHGFYLGENLLLDFGARIDLTLNADNSLVSNAFEVTEHILLP